MTGKRGPKISPDVQMLIREQALNSPKKRTELAEELESMILARGWLSPTIETMEKIISKIRNDRDRQDNPWSVSALADYDIPPEALPVVMQAWAKALEQDKPLTIRQVKWIARLHCVLGNIDGLIVRALEYASREKAIKLTGAYPDKPQNMGWLWWGDAIIYLNMTGDDSPLRKCMKSMKWQTTKDIAALKAELKIEQREAQNEDSNTTKRTDFHRGGEGG